MKKNIRKLKTKIAGKRHNKMKILDYFDGFLTMKNTDTHSELGK